MPTKPFLPLDATTILKSLNEAMDRYWGMQKPMEEVSHAEMDEIGSKITFNDQHIRVWKKLKAEHDKTCNCTYYNHYEHPEYK